MHLCAVNFFHCSVTLHVSGAFHTHHQEYINCIYSLRYRSHIGAAAADKRATAVPPKQTARAATTVV